MLVLCVAAVLGLLSAGQAAPLTCEALVKPLENTNLEMVSTVCLVKMTMRWSWPCDPRLQGQICLLLVSNTAMTLGWMVYKPTDVKIGQVERHLIFSTFHFSPPCTVCL